MALVTNNIAVDLPPLNGALDVGLAAGTDHSLRDDRKLKVYPVDLDANVKGLASAHWAYNTFAGAGVTRGLYVAAAYVCITYKLVSLNDGDSVTATTAVTLDDAAMNAMAGFLTTDWQIKAATAILATKLNWWATNHHTGTPIISGYARKVAMTSLGADGATLDDWATAMHTVGHWASTKLCLTKMAIGVGDITAVNAYPHSNRGIQNLVMTGDITARVNSPPAGTHKCAVAYAICKRLKAHPLYPYCPNVGNLIAINQTKALIAANPAQYHVGARYLTGNNRAAYNDADMGQYLGRLASFIHYCLPAHTLCKSPCVFNAAHCQDATYEDYNPGWATLCKAYKDAARTANSAEIDAIVKATTVVGVRADGTVMATLNGAFI